MRPFNVPGLRRCLLSALALLPLSAAGGQFGVSPIRIDLDRNAKSGAITVSNDADAESLRVQLRLFEWMQDVDGKDEYRESEDLLFFPRLMAIGKGEQKLVRIGLRAPATSMEKTYRLFIEELPAPPPPGGQGAARVAIAVRFGVPVFVKAMKDEIRGEIEKLEVAKGVLRVGVRNSGNTHFTIQSVSATSGDSFAKDAPGWYLLAGAARWHEIAIPSETCSKLKQIDVMVKTDKLELKRAVDVTPSMCKP